jgi:hypothetical protein
MFVTNEPRILGTHSLTISPLSSVKRLLLGNLAGIANLNIKKDFRASPLGNLHDS